MKNRCSRRIVLSGMLLMCSVLTCTAFAMIRTLSIEELVGQAEYIVVAQMYSVTLTRTDPSTRMLTLHNELRFIESLKGRWPAQRPIVLTTTRHEEHWIEDNVELPQPGTRVVLFLTRYRDRLVPVNGIQGVWPMQGRELLQMGTGKTLDDIREIVRDRKMHE